MQIIGSKQILYERSKLMQFLEMVKKNVDNNPDRIAVTRDFNEGSLSLEELWDVSGRIYHFLSENKIGREDFVLIKLPRGAKAVSTILGVIRAGAAFTIVEDIYPDDRINYIARDCSCKMVIDEAVYDKMLEVTPLEGYENADEHDACFAIYTSGTTGNPKGVLHEYGKIDYCLKSIPVNMLMDGSVNEKFAAIMPMNFVAFIFVVVACLAFDITIYMISFALAKNFVKFTQLLESEEITFTFMSPSMIRVYKNPATSLKLIITGSEPAGGIYYGKPGIYNIYAMSESGMAIAGFMLDKSYDKAPVGKNTAGAKILILKEDGEEATIGETGEICFENAYFRGYINLPSEDEKAVVDGIFHTGDLGYVDENGNLYISGRSDDMIKINGNRIEPAEIEAVAKAILKAPSIVAKGFEENSRAFVVLYAVENEIGDSFSEDKVEDLRDAMSSKLPEYMIPTYFVALPELPLNPNGKVAKKLLRSPVKTELKRNIVKPNTDTEKLICAKMAAVLKLNEVGVTEDFYYLGGDSLKTIQLVSDLEEEGITISAEEVYNGRSAREVAAVITKNSKSEADVLRETEEAKELAYPVTHQQWQIIQYNERSGGTKVNILAIRLKLARDIDTDKLKEAADRVLSEHSAVRIRFTRSKIDGKTIYNQSYDESFYEPTGDIKTSESKLQEVSEDIVSSIKYFDDRQYRSTIIRTEEGEYYLLALSHLITDGEGQRILLGQIAGAYKDKMYTPARDDYFYLIKQKFATQEKRIDKAKELYESIFDGVEPICINKDAASDDLTAGIIYLKDAMKLAPSLNNAFFITAYALAVCMYNKTDTSIVYSIYHGRDSKPKQHTVGIMIQEVFIKLDRTKYKSAKEMLVSVKEQMIQGMSLDTSMYLVDNDIDTRDIPRIIYQANRDKDVLLYDIATDSKSIRVSKAADGIVSLNLVERKSEGSLDLLLRYADKIYNKDSMASFLNYYKEAVMFLMKGVDA